MRREREFPLCAPKFNGLARTLRPPSQSFAREAETPRHIAPARTARTTLFCQTVAAETTARGTRRIHKPSLVWAREARCHAAFCFARFAAPFAGTRACVHRAIPRYGARGESFHASGFPRGLFRSCRTKCRTPRSKRLRATHRLKAAQTA